MKMTLMAVFLGTATMASAENFDNNVYTLTAEVGNLEFSLSETDAGSTNVTAGVYLFPATIGAMETDLLLSLGYNLDSDEYRVAAEYGMSSVVATSLTTHGSVEVAYESNDDVTVTPTVGLAYAFSPRASVFADVDYTFLASDDFARVDGTAELGFDFAVTDAMSVRPSVVTSFETEETNASLELVVSF